MQKDYLRRRAKRSAGTKSQTTTEHLVNGGASVPPSPASTHNHHHHLPRRAATLGSIKDNAGGEVIGERVILYIHGGAFFFSSLDTHVSISTVRQFTCLQVHVAISDPTACSESRSTCFCPRVQARPAIPLRMSTLPYPSASADPTQPCGLLDALAAYLYLLSPPPGAFQPILPSSITFMGDSAGAGMVVSLLIVIRETGLPMPAGATLISPWVDLTHSMPSISGSDEGDYIPSCG